MMPPRSAATPPEVTATQQRDDADVYGDFFIVRWGARLIAGFGWYVIWSAIIVAVDWTVRAWR